MTRLIDADELEKNLSNDLPYKGSVKRVLIQAPTVDAVEVVRCWDCLWANTNLFAKELGIVYCNNYGKRKKQDDFCSEGERKGDCLC